jgi:uncharacterized protein YjbJ (UPF0337 family)
MNTQEIRGHWDQIRGKVKEKWGQLTDDDLQMVGGNLEQIVGRIEQKTGVARTRVEEFLDELTAPGSPLTRAKEAAVGYAQAAAAQAREGIEQVREQAREGYARAGEVVQRHPAESMIAVFGLGMITGVVIGLLLRSEA